MAEQPAARRTQAERRARSRAALLEATARAFTQRLRELGARTGGTRGRLRPWRPLPPVSREGRVVLAWRRSRVHETLSVGDERYRPLVARSKRRGHLAGVGVDP